MSFYTFFKYLAYRRKAMGRHGTHSPFIYDLVENCIQKKGKQPLLPHLLNYLKDWEVVELNEPEQWQKRFSTLHVNTQTRLIIVVPSIYKTEDHTALWRDLSSSDRVRYSLDLFDFGLLLINAEFLQKQHFILKN